jgi:hypothetical protein
MFARPSHWSRIWQSRIVTADDGLYRGAENVVEAAEWADCAMVYDDFGEAWGTVAWLHDKPDSWWLGRYPFYRERGWPPIMGAAEVCFASEMDADLFLAATPESYVRRAWCGPWEGPTAAILDWKRPEAVRLWLSLVKGVQCETEALATAVESTLRAAPARQRLKIRSDTAEGLRRAA